MTAEELRDRLAKTVFLGNLLGNYSKGDAEPAEPAIRVGEPPKSWSVSDKMECVILKRPNKRPIGATYEGSNLLNIWRVYLISHGDWTLVESAVDKLASAFIIMGVTYIPEEKTIARPEYYIVDFQEN